MTAARLPRVALVGRTNVGKSSLFNRIVGRRAAVVEDRPGITRDIHALPVEWEGTAFLLMDTGGYASEDLDPFSPQVKDRIEEALREADLAVLLTDAHVGIHEEDQRLARRILQMGKPAILAVNKADNDAYGWEAQAFHRLGIAPLIPVSAQNGRGVATLLDAIRSRLRKTPPPIEENEYYPRPRLAIVGRPNVGKSTFLNTLLDQDRVIASPVAGTTRDAIAIPFRRFGKTCTLIDTAGIRARRKVRSDVEKFSVQRAVQAIRHADVAILLMDATEGVTAQDLRLLHHILDEGKGVVIAMNKKDRLPADVSYPQFEKDIRAATAPFTDYPLIFTAALQRKNLLKVLDAAEKVHARLTRKIPTARFNRFIQPILKSHHPPSRLGKLVRIKYAMQAPDAVPPTFLFYVNHPTLVAPAYKRFLENKIRQAFDFSGVPLRLIFKEK